MTASRHLYCSACRGDKVSVLSEVHMSTINMWAYRLICGECSHRSKSIVDDRERLKIQLDLMNDTRQILDDISFLLCEDELAG